MSELVTVNKKERKNNSGETATILVITKKQKENFERKLSK